MRVRFQICALLCLVGATSLLAEEPTTSGELSIQERYSVIDPGGNSIPFLVLVPSSYDPTRKSPLVVGLHGTAGNPQQILDYPGLAELAEERGYLVVCPSSSGWYGSSWLFRRPTPLSVRSDRHVADVLERVLDEFGVDEQRMYLLGVSLGGAGVWHLALKQPDRWAALAPITPASYHGTRDLTPLIDTGVIMVQGEKDTAVSVSANRRLVKAMEELGMDHRYIEIPGAGHDLSDYDVMTQVFDFFDARGVVRSSETHLPELP